MGKEVWYAVVVRRERHLKGRDNNMAGSPQWKVYNPKGEYVAACKHLEDAACVVALYGDGATIRAQHGRILWKDGVTGTAADSYDEVARIVLDRLAFGL